MLEFFAMLIFGLLVFGIKGVIIAMLTIFVIGVLRRWFK